MSTFFAFYLCNLPRIFQNVKAVRFKNVAIAGLACVDATHRVTSDELEARLAPALDRLGIPRGTLEALSGITARRFWDPGTQPSDVAALAGARALENANLDRSAIQALISTSVSKDYVEPSVASSVHGKLALGRDCFNFDVSNACLGFLDGMRLMGTLIDSGQVDTGLVVVGESSRYLVDQTIAKLLRPDSGHADFRDCFAALTLGSGAAAMVLTRADLAPLGHRLVGGVTLAATEHNHLCRGQNDSVITDSPALFAAGMELTRETFALAERTLGWRPRELDEFVLHQMSAAFNGAFNTTFGINPDRAHWTFPEFGNVGPASIPLTLCKSADLGHIRPGARVALAGIGSGLNCSMMEIQW